MASLQLNGANGAGHKSYVANDAFWPKPVDGLRDWDAAEAQLEAGAPEPLINFVKPSRLQRANIVFARAAKDSASTVVQVVIAPRRRSFNKKAIISLIGQRASQLGRASIILNAEGTSGGRTNAVFNLCVSLTPEQKKKAERLGAIVKNPEDSVRHSYPWRSRKRPKPTGKAQAVYAL